MKSLKIIALAVCALLLAACGAKMSQAYYNEKSQVLSSNYDGTYVIRTQVRGRNAAIDFTDAQRKVVSEALFEGFQPASSGIEQIKPIIFDPNARAKHEEYFNSFFRDGGEWTKYASLKDKRTATTTYKRANAQMVETVTVTIHYAALKQKMKDDGIIPQENMYQL